LSRNLYFEIGIDRLNIILPAKDAKTPKTKGAESILLL